MKNAMRAPKFARIDMEQKWSGTTNDQFFGFESVSGDPLARDSLPARPMMIRLESQLTP